MAGIGGVNRADATQEEVFKRVRQAAKLLKSAADLERTIESNRLRVRLLDPYRDGCSDLSRDPLEERLRMILEQLDEYGYV